MDMQSVIAALRGGQPQMTPPPQGGANMRDGAIALSPEYQKYRHEAMANGETPLPPAEWAATMQM